MSSAYWRTMAGIHRRSIEALDEKIKHLQQLRDKRKRLLDQATLRQKGVKPCKACGRLVSSPCNDSGGYYGDGPWDYVCRDFF